MNEKLDENRENISAGVIDDVNQDISPLVVNPVTDDLICEIIGISYDKIPYPKIKIDDNREISCEAIDDTEDVIPLVIDPSTNALLIEIT